MKRFKMARVILAILAFVGFSGIQTHSISSLPENSTGNWSEQQVEKVAQDFVIINLLTPAEMQDWKDYIAQNNGNVTLPQSELNEKDFEALTQYMNSASFRAFTDSEIEKNMNKKDSKSAAEKYLEQLQGTDSRMLTIDNAPNYSWEAALTNTAQQHVTKKVKDKRKELEKAALKEIVHAPKSIVNLFKGSTK